MDKNSETHTLLNKSNRYIENEMNSSCDEEEWSDSCSSEYSDSGSSVAEWEGLVDSFGELLYIDCHPQVAQQPKEEVPQIKQEDTLTRTVTRRSKRGKLSRLIKRRDNKRASNRSYSSYTDAYAPSEVPSSNKVTFHDFQEGEVREVTLQVDPQNRTKYGRRSTQTEALLGLNITTFSDGNRIMVAGFVPDSEAMKNRNIKIGDWLKSLNGNDITYQTINNFLEYITEPQEVKLTLQRIAAVEVTKDPPINELFNQSEFVRQLTNPNSSEEEILCEVLCNFTVGIIYLKTEDLKENGPEYDGVLYCYPKPMNRNILCNSRGTFITLNHLLPEVIKSKPLITTVIINGTITHIIYVSENDKLLLISIPDIRCSSYEALQTSKELIRCLEFCYQSIDKCFTTERYLSQLDRFFSRFFARLLTSGTWYGAPQQVELQELSIKVVKHAPVQFENLLGGAQFVSLPREAQMQLDDALNELEASDYRDWNEDPLNCQRLFTIIGSSFYHNGYMLASHLHWKDLVDVHCYCRQQGILHLSCTEPIRTMVLWREVFPSSCNRGEAEEGAYKTPQGRWFLLIVGNAKDMLMVLMEAGGCTSSPEEFQGPDVFYVEEAQETLKHIQGMGISALAEKWITLNSRPQVAVVDTTVNKQNKKMDFLGNIGFIKSPSPPPKASSPISKKPEVTSILKHRSSLNKSSTTVNLSGSSSLFSSEDPASEDSASQGASEISDEPVIGRRATRERQDSDDSDSDWDAYRPNSEISGNFDISDLKQLSDLTPIKLTAGEENMLYHYVHFDSTEGILMCPPFQESTSHIMDQIMKNFRKGCQNIHEIFQNTIRFKNMLAQDMVKQVVNKSLIAIKEHGVLFECFLEENGKKINSVTYWIVGRLFYNPHPRELYVCYQDNSPQNLIELAFRLGINAAG